MKAYPLNVHEIRFLEVTVKRRLAPKDKTWPKNFDFDGVTFLQEININRVETKDAPSNAFAVRFKNSINNEVGTMAPYDITIDVIGFFFGQRKISRQP